MTAPENWMEWVQASMAAEEEMRPVLEARQEAEARKKQDAIRRDYGTGS
jgi:hypothetical protein